MISRKYVAIAAPLIVALAVVISVTNLGSESPRYRVPNLIGESEVVARQTLQNDGFRVLVIVNRRSPIKTPPKDSVLTSNPMPGTYLNHGALVTIVIAE